MAGWKGGYLGDSYDRPQFREWLRKQKKPTWAVGITIHNSDAPYTLASVGGSQRMKNLAHFYRQKWNSGPHGFAMETRMYPGTPIHLTGTHSPSWNGSRIAWEAEGSFKPGKHSPFEGKGALTWNTMAWATAELFEWMGWEPNEQTIKLHKEDPKTTHDCPGSHIKKDWFIEKVKQFMGSPISSPVPAAPVVPLGTMVVSGVPAGDMLNTRMTRAGEIRGSIPNGTKVEVLEKDAVWARIRTPAGFERWVAVRYLAPLPPVSEAPKPAEPVVPKPTPQPTSPAGLQKPGAFRYSETWCVPAMKKIEGLRLKAYFDKPGWAIGYGHNSTSGIKPTPYEGMVINEAQADAMLHADLDECIRYLNTWVKVPLKQEQVDALCVHMFQQGPTQFRKRILPTLNAGNHAGVADLIEHMSHSNPGVERRRRFEAARYLGSDSLKW